MSLSSPSDDEDDTTDRNLFLSQASAALETNSRKKISLSE